MTFKQFKLQLFLLNWQEDLHELVPVYEISPYTEFYRFKNSDNTCQIFVTRKKGKRALLSYRRIKRRGLLGAHVWFPVLRLPSYTRLIEIITET